ncbi:MAG TPA: efflux RND transporter periplasmic adaptor subunit [Anaeromyxobacter sp.]
MPERMPPPPLAALLCAACALGLPGCASRGPEAFAGFVDAPVAAVAAQVAGRVAAIPVREGDAVTKGQVLASLDARDREAQVALARANLQQAQRALAEAEANLRAVLPTVGGAGADIARAQATLDEAQQNFTRTEELVKGAAASTQQLDAARARLREARAGLDSLTAGKAAVQGRVGAVAAAVANARAAVGVSQAAEQVAEVQLAQATVVSPFDGVVVNRNLEEGEWAAPGTPVVSVENHERLWVRLDVEETRLARVRVGQPAEVSVVAAPGRRFRGHVIEIGAEGEFAVNRDVKRGRPDIRTFRVRVALDERADELRPGMTAEVTLGAPGPAGDAPVANER